MPDDFPVQIKQFISEHIRSVADLEAVLLLRKHCDRAWTATEVGKVLATSQEMAARQLAGLSERNLLTRATDARGETFQYRQSPDLDAKTDLLAALYRERRVSVITTIYSQPGGDVRTFADSFKLRKDH